MLGFLAGLSRDRKIFRLPRVTSWIPIIPSRFRMFPHSFARDQEGEWNVRYKIREVKKYHCAIVLESSVIKWTYINSQRNLISPSYAHTFRLPDTPVSASRTFIFSSVHSIHFPPFLPFFLPTRLFISSFDLPPIPELRIRNSSRISSSRFSIASSGRYIP